MNQQEILTAILDGNTLVKDELANYSIMSFLRFSKSYFALKSIAAIMHFPAVCEESYQHLVKELQNGENDKLLNIRQNANLPDNELNRYLEMAVWKNNLIDYMRAKRNKSAM